MDATQTLVERLYQLQAKTPLFGIQRRNAKIVDLLHRIGEKGGLGAIAAVAPYLVFDSARVRVAACCAIKQPLRSALPEELLRLSSLFDTDWRFQSSYAWHRLTPSSADALVADESCRTAVLGLLSFHHNGFVRHEAVRLLTEIEDGSELSFLLIRLNDWVKPISDDARSAVCGRINQDYLIHFIRNLPLVLSLRSQTRHDHSNIVDRVIDLLVQPQNDALLATTIQSSNQRFRREIVRTALELNGEHRRRVILLGLASADGTLRLWSLKHVRWTFADIEMKPILIQMRRDRFMPARREAFRLVAQTSPNSAQETWRQALLDSHRSIRELARFEIAKLGGFDIPQFYRDTLVDAPHSLAALNGLCEAGEKSDVPAICRYLNSPLPSRRLAAVRGLARLGGEAAIPDLLNRLRDDSPSVVREVRRQLAPLLHATNAEKLFELLMEDHRRHVRSAVLGLIFEMGKWRSLPWLVRALSHEDQQMAGLAQNYIEAWFSPPRCNTVFTRPTDSERKAIEYAIEQAETGIEAPFLKSLRAWLANT